jgi:Resolvase, N terminal domain
MVSLEALDPLGQRLRTPGERRVDRRVDRRFESEQRLVAGHDAFGQGALGEVRAQPRHSVVELAHVPVDGRLMLTVLGGLAEFERELIRTRTGEGRARAKTRGSYGSTPKAYGSSKA